LCPVQSAFEFLARLRLMQPEFVFRNDHCRSHEPNSWLLLFDKNLPSCELFAERNLSIGTNHLDAGFGSESFHICELSLIGRSPATRSLYSAVLLHECTIARTPSIRQATGAHGDGTAKSAHEITNCDFKCSNSRAFTWNMKSAGNRSTFLLTACTAPWV